MTDPRRSGVREEQEPEARRAVRAFVLGLLLGTALALAARNRHRDGGVRSAGSA